MSTFDAEETRPFADIPDPSPGRAQIAVRCVEGQGGAVDGERLIELSLILPNGSIGVGMNAEQARAVGKALLDHVEHWGSGTDLSMMIS